jgi:cob(I)alamin adenosyltransferase
MTQRIYTKTGDTGETGLFGGGRVPKSHPRVEAYGTVDELNAVLGWACASLQTEWISDVLRRVQPDLFAIGAHLATPANDTRRAPKLPPLPHDRIADLESSIDTAESQLPALRAFILPGGSPGGAALHVARTVCRRAERRVVELARAEPLADIVLVYLNRLSDLLFVLARLENQHAGAPEQTWTTRQQP